MFELVRFGTFVIGVKMVYDKAKEMGFFPVEMLSASGRVLDWKKEREFTNWRNAVLNPNSNFFKTIDVGDGKKTVGWGLTEANNNIYPPDCKITHYGQSFTMNQIERMYTVVKLKFENLVKSYLKGLSVPQGVFDACVSVSYNTGPALFKNSNGSDTWFYKYLKQKEWEAARQCLDFWRSGGQVLPGLVARRMGEHAIYLGMQPKAHEYYLSVAAQFEQTKDKNLL